MEAQIMRIKAKVPGARLVCISLFAKYSTTLDLYHLLNKTSCQVKKTVILVAILKLSRVAEHSSPPSQKRKKINGTSPSLTLKAVN
jgi:hypothetical protein